MFLQIQTFWFYIFQEFILNTTFNVSVSIEFGLYCQSVKQEQDEEVSLTFFCCLTNQFF